LAVLVSAVPVARADTWAAVGVGHCQEVGSSDPVRGLRSDLDKRLPGSVLSEEDTATRLGGSATASPDEIKRLVGTARQSFYAGDYAGSSAELDRALHEIAALGPASDRWSLYTDAKALRAWAQYKQGQTNSAQATLRDVLAVDPRFELDPNQYPPFLRTLSASTVHGLRREAKHELTVITVPSGLEVYVGMFDVGPSPVTLKLPSGMYQVTAKFTSGARGLPRQVELPGAARVTLRQAVDGAVWPDRGPCLDLREKRPDRLELLQTLAARLRVRYVAAVQLEEPSPDERFLSVSVLDAAQGQELRDARVKLGPGVTSMDAVRELGNFLATGEVKSGVQVVRDTTAKPSQVALARPKGSGSSQPTAAQASWSPKMKRRVASYVIGGVAVAALGFGLVGGIERGAANSDFAKAYPKAHAGDPAAAKEASDAHARAKTAGTLEIVGVAVGSAAAVTAGVLFFSSLGDSAPVQASAWVGPGQGGVMVAGRF